MWIATQLDSFHVASYYGAIRIQRALSSRRNDAAVEHTWWSTSHPTARPPHGSGRAVFYLRLRRWGKGAAQAESITCHSIVFTQRKPVQIADSVLWSRQGGIRMVNGQARLGRWTGAPVDYEEGRVGYATKNQGQMHLYCGCCLHHEQRIRIRSEWCHVWGNDSRRNSDPYRMGVSSFGL